MRVLVLGFKRGFVFLESPAGRRFRRTHDSERNFWLRLREGYRLRDRRSGGVLRSFCEVKSWVRSSFRGGRRGSGG